MSMDIELFEVDGEEGFVKNSNGLKALVAEDSRSMRELISHLLMESGFRTVEASDGAQAMQNYIKGDFDFIVTDLHMPNLNGYQFLRQVASIARTKKQRTRVLVSSSDSKKATILKVLEIARSSDKTMQMGFLVKPWKAMDLLSQTRNLFQDKGPLLGLDQQIDSLTQENQVYTDENRLIIGISETEGGLKMELGCDHQSSIESKTIMDYLESLEEAVFSVPVDDFVCGLARLAHQSPQSMVTLLLLIKGIADKQNKTLKFVEAPPLVLAEVKKQGLLEFLNVA